MEMWEIIAVAILAGFGARIGWGAADVAGGMLVAFATGLLRGFRRELS